MVVDPSLTRRVMKKCATCGQRQRLVGHTRLRLINGCRSLAHASGYEKVRPVATHTRFRLQLIFEQTGLFDFEQFVDPNTDVLVVFGRQIGFN